jgi:hypothetical protein
MVNLLSLDRKMCEEYPDAYAVLACNRRAILQAIHDFQHVRRHSASAFISLTPPDAR